MTQAPTRQKSRHGLQNGTLVYPTRPDAPSSCAFHFRALSSNPRIFLSSRFTTANLQSPPLQTHACPERTLRWAPFAAGETLRHRALFTRWTLYHRTFFAM